MKKIKRTKDNPLIVINHYTRNQRRVCFWTENGKQRQSYYSRWLWAKLNGEIPKGYFIYHKDGNTLNDCIENYALISRSEHSRLHLRKDISTLDSSKKNKYKYLSEWNRINGETDFDKLIFVLKKYNIKNFQQLSELTNIDYGQLSRIRHNKCRLGWININRLFDYINQNIV